MDNEPIASVPVVDAKLTEHFKNRYKKFPPKARKLISTFIIHVRNQGFDGLPGRNKYSDDIDTNDPRFLEKIDFVKKFCLWHYHIGLHEYDTTNSHGDWTSMFVLHYARVSPSLIRIADMNPHPPFELPKIDMLTYPK